MIDGNAIHFTNSYAAEFVSTKWSYLIRGNDEPKTTCSEELLRSMKVLVQTGLNSVPSFDDYWSTKSVFSGSFAAVLIPSRLWFWSLVSFFQPSAYGADD